MFASGAVRRSVITSILPFVCIGILLFLIAGIVVLALIPTYIPQKTATLNPNTLRSKNVTVSIEVQESANSRRKRLTGDLYNYIGGQVDSSGIATVKSQILPFLTSQQVADLDISSISFGYEPNRRRKRFTLSKRQTYINHPIVMVITFQLIFSSSCLSSCQTNSGSRIQQTIYALPVTTFTFTNLPINLNGVQTTIPQILCITVTYVSEIISGLSSNTQATPTVTVTLTNPTTISATPSLG